MSEHLNPVATASADPAQLVIGVERIGKALNLISANVKGNADDRFNEESKKARIVQQKEALKIVAQTIQAMIQELEQAGGDNTHIRELSAIQQSCVSAAGHEHEIHHEHIGHAAASAFALAKTIHSAANQDNISDVSDVAGQQQAPAIQSRHSQHHLRTPARRDLAYAGLNAHAVVPDHLTGERPRSKLLPDSPIVHTVLGILAAPLPVLGH